MTGGPANGHGQASAVVPYRRGWRAPWRGQWGGFDDGHTRLSFLARRIEGELREAYNATTPLAERQVRLAARYQALAEATLSSIGRDPKATRRAATALQAAADRQLAALEVLGAKRNGHGRPTLPELAPRKADHA